MKLIKNTIAGLILIVPIVLFWIFFFNVKEENIGISWFKCFIFGTILAIFFANLSDKFGKWFDSKLK